jgi:hypothetical protein
MCVGSADGKSRINVSSIEYHCQPMNIPIWRVGKNLLTAKCLIQPINRIRWRAPVGLDLAETDTMYTFSTIVPTGLDIPP